MPTVEGRPSTARFLTNRDLPAPGGRMRVSLTRLTARDHVGSALVALIVIAYCGYRVWDEMPFPHDPRGVAALGLLLGWSAFSIMRGGDILDWTGLAEVVLAVVSLVLGLATLIFAQTPVAETLLAVFVTSIVVVWTVELLDHLGILPSHHVRDAAQ